MLIYPSKINARFPIAEIADMIWDYSNDASFHNNYTI